MIPFFKYYTQLTAKTDSDTLKDFEEEVNEVYSVRPSVHSVRSDFPFPSDLDLDKQAKYICGTINLQLLYGGLDSNFQTLEITPQGDNCKANGEVLENCDCSDPDTYDFYDEGRR